MNDDARCTFYVILQDWRNVSSKTGGGGVKAMGGAHREEGAGLL